MTEPADHPLTEQLRDDAVAWLVRVQSDAAGAEDWAALTDWLEASPVHLAAFEAAERLSAEIDEQAGQIAEALAGRSKVVAFRPHRRPPAAWVSGLVAAAAALVVGPMLWNSYQGPETVYTTRVGETRTVRLTDGSQVTLDSGSRLSVRLGWRTRRVEMGQAQASFDVAKDPSRPFIIGVGDQQVRVVGTAFNIRHFDGTVTVTVNRGIVQVSQAGGEPERLTVGDELRHVEGQPTSTRIKVDPAQALAWTQGRLVCEDRTLTEIVADINRHYPRPIRLAGAAGSKRFSGVLELGDQDALVRRLAGYLSLRVDRSGGEIVLR